MWEVRLNMQARSVCCGVLVDTSKAPVAKTKGGEDFLVCNQQCKKVVETMTPEQLKQITATKLE